MLLNIKSNLLIKKGLNPTIIWMVKDDPFVKIWFKITYAISAYHH